LWRESLRMATACPPKPLAKAGQFSSLSKP
jgi:hypothetical protein